MYMYIIRHKNAAPAQYHQMTAPESSAISTAIACALTPPHQGLLLGALILTRFRVLVNIEAKML